MIAALILKLLRRLDVRDALRAEHAPCRVTEDGEQLAREIEAFLSPVISNRDPGDEDDGWRREEAA